MTGIARWEYRRRVAFPWNEMSIMKEMAGDGWELCGIRMFWLYFKRQPRPVSGRRAAYA